MMTTKVKHIAWSDRLTHIQNQPKSLFCSTHGQTRIMHETLTAGIMHTGFSGLQRLVARKKSWCTLIEYRFVLPHGIIPASRLAASTFETRKSELLKTNCNERSNYQKQTEIS